MSNPELSEPIKPSDIPDSPILKHEAEAADQLATTFCYANGSPYSVGSIICNNGQLIQCLQNGMWIGLPNNC